jgi:spastin
VESEIMDTGPGVSWDDIAGCEDVKEALQELLIRPTQRPDLYNGVRNPAKGLLLAGPPGTGKTLCAKAAATECGSGMGKKVTFFSVSSSTFASKWHGDGEKLMRALFEVARARQPSLLFFDEVDSLLGARGSGEHEASRRLKTEFLVQVDGATGAAGESVFVMGATNRPQDLDDAVLRRLSKRIYVPLPPRAARLSLLEKLTVDAAPPRSSVTWSVTRADLSALAAKMPYFSGADIHALVREASLMPLRELPTAVILSVDAKKVRGVSRQDFETALAQVKPSVSKAQLAALERWDEEFGLGSSARRAARPGEPSPGGGATMSIPRVFQAPSKPLRRKRRPRD